MNRLSVIMMAAGLLMLSACKDKKNVNADIITTDYEAPVPKSPIAMESSEKTIDVEWNEGRTYTVDIVRQPADSLPKAVTDEGQEYVDNSVGITIRREDGSVFFNRTFTKAAFTEWVDKDYRSNSILEGINFFMVSGNELLFTATINHPDASDDEAVDLKLSLNAQGQLGIGHYDENLRDDLEEADKD